MDFFDREESDTNFLDDQASQTVTNEDNWAVLTLE
jgi:hypothetical protein